MGEDYLYLNKARNLQLMAELVQEQRSRFRSQQGIPAQKVVLLLAPGNDKREIAWSIKRANGGIKHLFQKKGLSDQEKANFMVYICHPGEPGTTEMITKSVQLFTWPCEVKYSAAKYPLMCAADVGIVHNGEFASECAAMQLPFFVLDSKPFIQAYVTQWFEQWNLDLNIMSKGETF